MSGWALDASVRRTGGGRLLVGGTPPRLVRLSEAGARALDSLLAEGVESSPPPGGRPSVRETQRGQPGVRLPDGGTTADTRPDGRTTADAGPDGRTTADAGPERRSTAAEGPDGRSTAAEGLAARLGRQGILHPLPGDGAGEPEVTTVIPALDGGERLVALVRVLVEEGPVIVVDDGSRDGSGERAAAAGARVIRPDPSAGPAAISARVGRPDSLEGPTVAGARVGRRDAPRGPAAARNAGLRAAETELVAFLDADCIVEPGWRRGLASMLETERGLEPVDERAGPTPVGAADRGLALVAPRVRSAPGRTVLARYEEVASPLDLGPHAGLVGPERRTAYVPAAALVARRDALLEVGGFDEAMRFGEDVDLVWRLLAAGHGVRYVPSRVVHHAPRPTIGAMVRQRAGYGASAPDLARRHGPAVAPLRVSSHTIAVWGAALAAGVRPFGRIGTERTNAPAMGVRPWFGISDQRTHAPHGRRAALTAAALGGSAALVARSGTDRDSRAALAGLALRGHATATRHLARALVREWLPLSLLAAARSPGARRLVLAAAVLDLLAGDVPGAERVSAARLAGDMHGAERTPAAPPSAPQMLAGDMPGAERISAASPSAPQVRAAAPPSASQVLATAAVLRPLDHAAYATGLWRGAIAARDPRALLPRLTSRSGRT